MTDSAFGRTGGRDGDLALALYLEPLIEGRRLLLLGGVADEVRVRVARVVDEVEVVEADALEGELELPFATRAFDVVWLVDSALLNPSPDALAELKRVLAREGALVVCSSIHPDSKRLSRGRPEQRLARVLEPEFAELRLLRQSAVHGHALEDLAAPSQDIAVDTSLLADVQGSVVRVVAIASNARLRLDPRLWVQLPVVDGHDDDSLRVRLAEAVASAKTLSHTLDAAELDLEDAFARTRALESQLAEKEAAEAHEREHRLRAERSVERAKSEIELERKRVTTAEAERDAARAEVARAASECADLEARLAERGAHIQGLELELKRREAVARDLIEELQRIEHEHSGCAAHQDRVTQLEGEVRRALARALEAEAAREAAEMRVDELRACILRLEAQPPAPTVDAELESTLQSLRTRLRELEQTLQDSTHRAAAAAASLDAQRDSDRGEIAGLNLRLVEAERALTHLRGYEIRVHSLERELEEADRFAESHADDAERIETLELELASAQRRFDEVDDDLRATQDELRAARAEIEHLAVETSARIELAQRRENEARTDRDQLRAERDQARAALEEARGILAQLTGKVNAGTADPSVS